MGPGPWDPYHFQISASRPVPRGRLAPGWIGRRLPNEPQIWLFAGSIHGYSSCSVRNPPTTLDASRRAGDSGHSPGLQFFDDSPSACPYLLSPARPSPLSANSSGPADVARGFFQSRCGGCQCPVRGTRTGEWLMIYVWAPPRYRARSWSPLASNGGWVPKNPGWSHRERRGSLGNSPSLKIWLQRPRRAINLGGVSDTVAPASLALLS